MRVLSALRVSTIALMTGALAACGAEPGGDDSDAIPRAGDEPQLEGEAVSPPSGVGTDQFGYWSCTINWGATTSIREMQGHTRFECGGGVCGDLSHTQPSSTVDIVGGVSQSCEDSAQSFTGPLAGGEWNGCLDGNQISTGEHPILGVNQLWDRFPYLPATVGGSGYPFYGGGSCRATAPVPKPGASPLAVSQPFMSIYDLDFCPLKQFIGTIQFNDIPLSVTKTVNTAAQKAFSLYGYAAKQCGTDGNSNICSTNVCSDLKILGTYTCNWINIPQCYCTVEANGEFPICPSPH